MTIYKDYTYKELLQKMEKKLETKNDERPLITYLHDNQPYTIKCDQTLKDFLYFVGKALYVKEEHAIFDPLSPLSNRPQMIIYELSVNILKKKEFKSKSTIQGKTYSPGKNLFLFLFDFYFLFFIFIFYFFFSYLFYFFYFYFYFPFLIIHFFLFSWFRIGQQFPLF